MCCAVVYYIVVRIAWQRQLKIIDFFLVFVYMRCDAICLSLSSECKAKPTSKLKIGCIFAMLFLMYAWAMSCISCTLYSCILRNKNNEMRKLLLLLLLFCHLKNYRQLIFMNSRRYPMHTHTKWASSLSPSFEASERAIQLLSALKRENYLMQISANLIKCSQD